MRQDMAKIYSYSKFDQKSSHSFKLYDRIQTDIIPKTKFVLCGSQNCNFHEKLNIDFVII